MSKNRNHNLRKRILRKTLAEVRRSGIVVIHVEPAGRQGLISWKNGQSFAADNDIAEGILTFPHNWAICLAVFCRSDTQEYMKSVDLLPDRALKSESLAAECEEKHYLLESDCNPKHIIGKGFIASPVGKRLTEAEAEKLFDLCGAWQQERFEPAGLFADERTRLIAALENVA